MKIFFFINLEFISCLCHCKQNFIFYTFQNDWKFAGCSFVLFVLLQLAFLSSVNMSAVSCKCYRICQKRQHQDDTSFWKYWTSNANTVHVKSIISFFFVFTMNWDIRSDTLILIQILVLLVCIPCSWEKNPNKFDINVSSVTWNLNNSIQVRRIFTM